MSFIKKQWPVFLFLALLVLGVYANAQNNAFVSDDIAEIRENPLVGQFAYIWNIPIGFARPLVYWFAYQLGGLDTFFYRFFDLLFHLGSVWLVFIIIFHLINKRVAVFAAFLMAVHPLLSEAVIWISGGGYVQYTFFFLLSLLAYIRSKNNIKTYLLSPLFYLLSLTSQSVMPMPLFLIFFLYEFTFGNIKANWKKLLIFPLIASIWVIYNLNILPQREATLQTMHYQNQEESIDNPLVQIPVAITSYFELFIWPGSLTLYHSELALGTINFIIRLIVTVIFFGAIIYSLIKKKKIFFFWASFFLIALSPTLTPLKVNWIVAERYVYAGSIGLFVIVAYFLGKLYVKTRYRSFITIFFVILIMAFSFRTFMRNIDWKNEDNLWIATGKTSPSSPNTHNNLGDVYGRRGDKQAALKEFQRAIELKPNYGDAYHNLANTYMELNQPDKALENYQNALKFNPTLWQSYQNIAAIYFNQKQYEPAIEYMQKAIQVHPKNLNLRINLGVVYLSMGDKEKAKEVFNQILAFDPNNQIAKQGLAEASKN